jgi:hypothetical protein
MAGTRQQLPFGGVCLETEHEILEGGGVGGQWKEFEAGDEQMGAAFDKCHAGHAEHLDMRLAVDVDREHADLANRKRLVGFEPAAGSAELGNADDLMPRQRAPSRQIRAVTGGFHEATSALADASI